MKCIACEIFLLTSITLMTGCATTKEYGATGGSRSDGTVKLSYQYGEFEEPVVDTQKAVELARTKCRAWGYDQAEAFGTEIKTCAETNQYGCVQWLVTAEYQCLGGPNK